MFETVEQGKYWHVYARSQVRSQEGIPNFRGRNKYYKYSPSTYRVEIQMFRRLFPEFCLAAVWCSMRRSFDFLSALYFLDKEHLDTIIERVEGSYVLLLNGARFNNHFGEDICGWTSKCDHCSEMAIETGGDFWIFWTAIISMSLTYW